MTCRLSELIWAEDTDGSVLFFTTYGWDKIFSRTFEVNPDDDKSRVENSRSMSTSSKLRGEEALPARVEETLSYVTSSVWRLDDFKSKRFVVGFRKVPPFWRRGMRRQMAPLVLARVPRSRSAAAVAGVGAVRRCRPLPAEHWSTRQLPKRPLYWSRLWSLRKVFASPILFARGDEISATTATTPAADPNTVEAVIDWEQNFRAPRIQSRRRHVRDYTA